MRQALNVCMMPVLAIVMGVSGSLRQDHFSSMVLGRDMKYNAYLPANYSSRVQAGKKFSVVYLLHSLNLTDDAWHQGWGGFNPQVDVTIDSVSGIIAVAPDDGTTCSWWLDSPTGDKYTTYLVTEFKKHIDSLFATLPDRSHTGVCGTSMGGYGALHNSSLHPEIFGAAYAVVPCTDLIAHQTGLKIELVLGAYAQNAAVWKDATINGNAARFGTKNGQTLHLGFHTNQNDGFKNEITAFHDSLTSLGITHQFALNPTGGHDYPDAAGMVAILRFFEKNFASTAADPLAPAFAPEIPHAQNRFVKQLIGRQFHAVGVMDRKTGRTYTINGALVKKTAAVGR